MYGHHASGRGLGGGNDDLPLTIHSHDVTRWSHSNYDEGMKKRARGFAPKGVITMGNMEVKKMI